MLTFGKVLRLLGDSIHKSPWLRYLLMSEAECHRRFTASITEIPQSTPQTYTTHVSVR